jgi:hypothetical protein
MNIEQRFGLETRLQQGLVGTVYRAVDTSRSGAGAAHRVALLVLPRRLTMIHGAAARLEENFPRLRELDHPNIASVFELLRRGNRFIISSEFVDGDTLLSVLRKLSPGHMDEEDATHLLRCLGSALEYAHGRGVVHGSVRAENIVVTPWQDAKLINFVFGTLVESGPLAVTEEDDVRDFAKLAYELYTGMRPPVEWGEVPPYGLTRRRWLALRSILCEVKHRQPRTLRQFLVDADLVGAPPARAATRQLEPATNGGGRRFWRVRLPLALIVAAALFVGSRADIETVANLDFTEGLRWTRTAADAVAALLPQQRERDETRTPPTSPVDPQEAALAGVPERIARVEPVPDFDPAAATRRSRAAGPQGGAPPAAAAPATVEFAQAEVRVNEYETIVAIEVRRSGDTTLPVEFIWWTSDGTATAEDDYANFGRRVEAFDLGAATHAIRVPLVSDAVSEPDEHFYVHIDATIRGATLGSLSTAFITIVDDD